MNKIDLYTEQHARKLVNKYLYLRIFRQSTVISNKSKYD